MPTRTLLQLGVSLAVACAIGGIGVGVAQDWGGEAGGGAMWSAALIGLLAVAARVWFAGILRDVGAHLAHTLPSQRRDAAPRYS